jgi:hypothetical protein
VSLQTGMKLLSAADRLPEERGPGTERAPPQPAQRDRAGSEPRPHICGMGGVPRQLQQRAGLRKARAGGSGREELELRLR